MVFKSAKSQQTRQFKFWLDHGLQDGMQYQHALFRKVYTLGYHQRHQLYQQASQFAQQGADTLITYEQDLCHLWLNLKNISNKSISIDRLGESLGIDITTSKQSSKARRPC